MITAPQFNLTRMLDAGNVPPAPENQGLAVPQSFMDLVREAAQGGNENRNMAETMRQDEGRAQENTPESAERAVDDVGSPDLRESTPGAEHQIEHVRGNSFAEKNRTETERQHQMQEQGIGEGKNLRGNDESRVNKLKRGEHAPGKKLDNSPDAEEMNGAREHTNARTAELREHAQAVLEALRSAEVPSAQLKEFERALKAFQEQFEGADGARRMQLAQELRARLKDVISRMDGRDETGRSNNEAHTAHFKGRLKALAESLERGRQSGGERREDSGNAPAGLKENVQNNVSRESSNLHEMRFEIGKQADVSARTDGAVHAPSRGSMPQMNASVSPRVPFMNEQFEMLMQQARITVRDARNGSFVMNLYPETLGRVNVNLGLEDGVLVGRFLVDTPEAREAMMESMDRLLSQLADAGIEVGAFQVNVRGERDRLVQNLQGYFAENRRKAEHEGRSEYDAQAVRTHDGLLDVIA